MLAGGLSHLCSFLAGVQLHVTPEFTMNGIMVPSIFVGYYVFILLVNSENTFVQLQVYTSVNSPLANLL